MLAARWSLVENSLKYGTDPTILTIEQAALPGGSQR